MTCPQAALFDLDDTLALNWESPTPEMTNRLLRVLSIMPVAIVTGRDFPWMNREFLPALALSAPANRLYVLPEGAAQSMVWNGSAWDELYGQTLEDDDRKKIRAAILAAVEESGALEGLPLFGDRFVERKAAIAFSALGWEAPREWRTTWDPDNKRRKLLQDCLAPKLPEFDVLMGGATTIDVTKKGVNKSFGVRWLSQHLGIAPKDMLYVGDALYPGGNDYVVIETGIKTRSTSGPQETAGIIDELLAACAA
jgi:HAD superfamily hydrolase (TIGR01484 family)